MNHRWNKDSYRFSISLKSHFVTVFFFCYEFEKLYVLAISHFLSYRFIKQLINLVWSKTGQKSKRIEVKKLTISLYQNYRHMYLEKYILYPSTPNSIQQHMIMIWLCCGFLILSSLPLTWCQFVSLKMTWLIKWVG